MRDDFNLFSRLGVTPTASDAEIKAAYQATLKRVHPDHGGSITDFHAVTHAWRVLSNPALKAAHVKHLTPGYSPPVASEPTDSSPEPELSFPAETPPAPEVITTKTPSKDWFLTGSPAPARKFGRPNLSDLFGIHHLTAALLTALVASSAAFRAFTSFPLDQLTPTSPITAVGFTLAALFLTVFPAWHKHPQRAALLVFMYLIWPSPIVIVAFLGLSVFSRRRPPKK